MKVLHIIQTMSFRYGGPVITLKALAHHQALAGDQVTICTTNTDYPTGILHVPTDKPVIKDKITIYYHSVQFRLLLLSLSFYNWINSHIKEFDVVHIHGLYRFPVTYAAYAARKTGVPYAITFHGALDPFLYNQSRYNLFLKRIYERLFDFPNINHASAINFTTENERNRAKFLGFSARTYVVPSGIDWPVYLYLPDRGNFRKNINIDQNAPLVLFLGRLNAKKGLDLLIPAFSKIVKTIPDARLAIVGPDNEGLRHKIVQWCFDYGIHNRVKIVGHLSTEQVNQAYVDADVFVLSSYTENFGRTIVEAMACGCPVILSDQVNICTEIKRANAGLVVRLDIQEISDAILSILHDKDLSQRLSNAGRKLARNSYAYDRIIDRVTQMYKNMTKDKSI